MTKKKEKPEDNFGTTSIISGILCSNSQSSIMGFTPGIELLSAKSFTNTGQGDFSSVVAGVLWSILKNSNIIIMPLSYENDNQLLCDAIKKATNENIIILTTHGDGFPSKYENVISVKWKESSIQRIKSFKNNQLTLELPNRKYITTLSNKSFVEIETKDAILSMATAIVVALNNKKNPGLTGLSKAISQFISGQR